MSRCYDENGQAIVFSKLSLIEKLRNNLQPTGTARVVQLNVGGVGLYDFDFISSCIDDLERLKLRLELGDRPNNLEKLAYQILCESAYLDWEKYEPKA